MIKNINNINNIIFIFIIIKSLGMFIPMPKWGWLQPCPTPSWAWMRPRVHVQTLSGFTSTPRLGLTW